jgi:hypothetical protein
MYRNFATPDPARSKRRFALAAFATYANNKMLHLQNTRALLRK